MWLLEPAKPVRVYSQGAYGYMEPINGSHDVMFTTVTMDNGVVVMIGGGWNFPESFPNYCSTWIEITGTEGALVLDDTARDHWLNTEKDGQEFPMSTMPGEMVDHVFAGGMGPETIHFVEACIRNSPVMVTPESARMVMETYTAADLSADRNEPVDLPLTNETIAAVADFKAKFRKGDNNMRTPAKDIGLAIIGGGRVGLFRGEVANRHPAVKWIGVAEKNPNRAGEVAPKIGADFVTQSHVELLKRPEVTCAIIATDEHLHVDPIMAAVERGIPMLIEKPLATDLAQSARVLKAITDAKLDAVVGYTQRFRRKWLGAKEKVRTGALGDVTLVTSRAFMNRLVAIDNYKRTDDPSTISPMVISGTHALDIVMWYMEKKTPVECYARSIDKVLGPLYQRHRRHRRHDHVLGRQRLSPQHLVGAAGDLAGLGLFARGRHQRHRRRAHHRRHPPRHGAGGVEGAGGRLRPRHAPGWSTSWAAIRPATWRSANCAARWRTRPCPGSTAWRSACRPRPRPPPRRTAT